MGAAVESFRNEVVKDNNELIQLMQKNPEQTKDMRLVNDGGLANTLQLEKGK